MSGLETLSSIKCTSLLSADLRYCLVTSDKRPMTLDGVGARPNVCSDFASIDSLSSCVNLDKYAGIGISVQASKICAIDVDRCFGEPFDLSSADERAIDILARFKDVAYCEFSFSGSGLRVLFKCSVIDDYTDSFYIKNSKNHIEYYQPTTSYRYVTVTGKSIFDNAIQDVDLMLVESFLNDYMRKPERAVKVVEKVEDCSDDMLMVKVKRLYFADIHFQNLWFSVAPGSGKNESELDYALLSYIFEKITQNKSKVKLIFEASPYFKSKDWKHIKKWNAMNYRYFEYVFSVIAKGY